nr:reverse transcriptase domain-containing protein [Tanacetum cinerariifolium]
SRCGSRRTVHTAYGYMYKEFLNCQPRNFKGTKGVVGLARWFENMESVFHISNGAIECQVKYATCTLLDGSLTWWNSHVKTVKIDAVYDMPWKELTNCKRIGHLTKDCRSPAAATNQRAPMANQNNTITFYECGKQGHYRSESSKLKKQNHGNPTGNGEVRGRVYALGGE